MTLLSHLVKLGELELLECCLSASTDIAVQVASIDCSVHHANSEDTVVGGNPFPTANKA